MILHGMILWQNIQNPKLLLVRVVCVVLLCSTAYMYGSTDLMTIAYTLNVLVKYTETYTDKVINVIS